MRIAYIATDFVPVSETFIRDLCHGLHHRGHSVTVFCQREIAGSHPGQLHVKALGSEPRASFISRVRRLCMKGKADRTDEFDWQRRQNWFLRTFSDEIAQMKPDVLYAEYGWNGVLACEIAVALGKPLVVHLHGLDASQYLAQPAYVRRLSYAVRQGVKFIVPSEHLRRRVTVACGDSGEISVIHSAPDLEILRRGSQGAPTGQMSPRIAAVGRLTSKKAPQVLIHVMALVRKRVPAVQLDLVGDGPLIDEVRRTIDMLGMQGVVTLHGAVDDARKLEIMRGARVFVQHSVTSASGDQEGLPLAILEAMAMQIPIVSTLHSGIPEVVEEGVDGFLVREWDFETMADRIVHILQSGFRPQCDPEGRVCSLDERIQRIEAVLADAVLTLPETTLGKSAPELA